MVVEPRINERFILGPSVTYTFNVFLMPTSDPIPRRIYKLIPQPKTTQVKLGAGCHCNQFTLLTDPFDYLIKFNSLKFCLTDCTLQL